MVHILVDLFHLHTRTFDEELAKVVDNVVLECKHHLLGAERLQQDQFLEVSNFCFPISWQFLGVRFRTGCPLGPKSFLFFKGLNYSSK